jgi:hypothetical protein
MTHPTDALRLATRFHETYERLAPSFGYETREDTKAFDPKTPNGRLMIAVCAELAAAPASPLPGGEWQNISTAPKDGTKVLGWSEGDFTVVEWSSGGYWTLSECGAYASDGEWWPTHWMPLPAAPTGAK